MGSSYSTTGSRPASPVLSVRVVQQAASSGRQLVMSWTSTSGLIGLAVLAAGWPGPAGDASASFDAGLTSPSFDKRFRSHWHDSRAELAGYALTYPRYGELRRGTAVTIFVTEPFSNRTRVKPDRKGPGDFEVIKLNLMEDFSTGIYDYNLMTSVFVPLERVNGRPAGSTSKISFSSQEWCGHVFQQVLFDKHRLRYVSHSYFDGEADEQGELAYPAGALAEDALPLWARGMAGPRLGPGETVTVPILRQLARVRLDHVPLTWDRATLSRDPTQKVVETTAGRFRVEVLAARIAGDGNERTWTFDVEAAFPHRIVRWSRSDGLEATLLAAKRLAYWKLNQEGKQSVLAELGLGARPRNTP